MSVLQTARARSDSTSRQIWGPAPSGVEGFSSAGSRARGAAEAARCAGDQGHFWEYHDLLFANQQSLAPDDLKRHASTLQLDPGQFAACLEQGAHRAEITADLEEGARHGIEATPTVFINGRPVIGAQPFDAYDKVIEEELSR